MNWGIGRLQVCLPLARETKKSQAAGHYLRSNSSDTPHTGRRLVSAWIAVRYACHKAAQTAFFWV